MLEIEIVESNIIEGGVEVFARAWRDSVQIGFGADGTVDIERFRIINPPVLIEDSNGTVVIENTNADIDGNLVTTSRTFREDPEQAIVDSLFGTIAVMKNVHGSESIIAGKRGNTTTTVYAGAGDGAILGYQTETTASQALWDELHDTADPTGSVSNLTSATAINGDTYCVRAVYSNAANGVQIGRTFLPFDTSSIPDGDTISAATLSVWSQCGSVGNITVGLVQTSQASTSTITSTDFDQCGAINSPTEGATRVTLTSATYAYIDWVLNATGLGWIDKAGTTKLGLRSSFDMDDSLPTLGSDLRMGTYFSEAAGTSNDPKLVVEHAAGGGSTNNEARRMHMMMM